MKCNKINEFDIPFKDSIISWERFGQVSCKLVINKTYAKFIRHWDIVRLLIFSCLGYRHFSFRFSHDLQKLDEKKSWCSRPEHLCIIWELCSRHFLVNECIKFQYYALVIFRSRMQSFQRLNSLTGLRARTFMDFVGLFVVAKHYKRACWLNRLLDNGACMVFEAMFGTIAARN